MTPDWNFLLSSAFEGLSGIFKVIERTGEVIRVGFGQYEGYEFYEGYEGYDDDSILADDDIEEFLEGPSRCSVPFNEITQNVLAYGASVDAENRPSWNEQLTLTFDEMDTVLEQLIDDDWNANTYFREQLVVSGAFN